jgi:hypothetical protein
MTIDELLTAAVVLDDVEWLGAALRLEGLPKGALRQLLEGALDDALLKSGITSPGDITLALARIAPLIAALMDVPEEVPSITVWKAMRSQATTSLVLTDSRSSELAQMRSAEQVRARAEEVRSVMADTRAREREWRAGFREEVASERSLFTAFARMMFEWFERRDWCAQRIPKAGVYSILSDVASAAGPIAWSQFVRPELQRIRDAGTDSDLVSAAQTCIQEHF